MSDETWQELKRFSIYLHDRGRGWVEVKEAEDVQGPWLKADEALARLAALEAELQQAQAALKPFRQYIADCQQGARDRMTEGKSLRERQENAVIDATLNVVLVEFDKAALRSAPDPVEKEA